MSRFHVFVSKCQIPKSLPVVLLAVALLTISSRPLSTNLFLNLANVGIMRNDFKGVLDVGVNKSLEQLYDSSSQDCRPPWRMGEIAEKKQDYSAAKDLLAVAFARCPSNPIILFDLGLAHYHLGEHTFALDAWRRVGAIWPILDLAEKALAAKDLEVAFQAYQATIDLWPTRAVGYRGLGQVLYLQTGDSGAARNWLERAIAVEPTDPWSYVILSDIYAKEKDFDRARQVLDESHRANPNSEVPWLYMGVLALSRGFCQEAIGDLQGSIQLNPSNAGAHAHLSLAYLCLHDLPSAFEHAKRGVAINPDNTYYRRILGMVCEALERYDDAVHEYSIVLSMEPDDQMLRSKVDTLLQLTPGQ